MVLLHHSCLQGQHLSWRALLPLSHAIQDCYGYLSFLGTQHSEMWQFGGFGRENTGICGLFINMHEFSVVLLFKGREELGLGLCWTLTSLWMRQTGVCQPGSPVPNSSQIGISGFKGDCPSSYVNSRLCTQLTISAN